jgi:hypothetical protein
MGLSGVGSSGWGSVMSAENLCDRLIKKEAICLGLKNGKRFLIS